MVPPKTEMTSRSFPIFDIMEDTRLIYKKSVRKENGCFFLEKAQEFGGVRRLISSLRGMANYQKELTNKKCRFCDISYISKENKFLIAGKSEPCPTKISVQRNLVAEGIYLLNNIGGWHTFNELLITKDHFQNIFEISVSTHEALLRAAISRWVLYEDLKDELFNHFDNFGKPFWLCMTSNDRLGASIFHFHSHVSLSPFKPRFALAKSRNLHSSIFGDSENFEIGCFHGLNLEMVVRSKKPLLISDLKNESKLKKYSEELSFVRYFLLNIIKDHFKYAIPLTEGVFASYLSKSRLLFLISPFFPYGALERYRGYIFFASSRISNAAYIKRKLNDDRHLKELMGDRIHVV